MLRVPLHDALVAAIHVAYVPFAAMGRDGIYFIEKFPGLEGYVVDKNGIGTETNGFAAYVKN